MRNMTYDEIIRIVRYKPTENGWDAYVGKEYIGSISGRAAENEKAFNCWKSEVRRKLASICRTIKLETKCGCYKIMDLPIGYDRSEWRVPLPEKNRIASFNYDEPISPFFQAEARIFRFHNRLDENGLRVFSEE